MSFVLDRVVDELNPQNAFTRRQVDVLLQYQVRLSTLLIQSELKMYSHSTQAMQPEYEKVQVFA